jgi:deazaflavin-dependent oxidoreductase (nitroreductase family)
MGRWPYSDDDLRAMYARGRGNATARRFARFWAAVLGTGLFPRRWVTLEVAGRRTGRTTRFPLGMADWRGDWYLVSMLGQNCNWVRNIRAAGGRVTIRHGRGRACHLIEVPAEERAPILKRYLQKVPGARPHIPVDPNASLTEFEAIAAQYPAFRVESEPVPNRVDEESGKMTARTTPEVSVPSAPERPRRKRHWLRWTLAGIAALIVILVAAVAVAIKLQPVPAPLALPASAAAPAGPLDDTWQVTSGSVAGFRIQQTVLGLTSEVVGRTEDVTGTVAIAGGQVTTASLRINLLALTSGGKPAPQFGISLDTQHHPDATVTLTEPVALDGSFTGGAKTTVTATGQLTLHGVTRTVTVPLTARRDGANLAMTGSFPVTFADYGIARPNGYGALGSLADHGTAEFLLILHSG